MNQSLVIAGTAITQDADGRFSLNDLHRAAGGADALLPNRWTRTGSYKALVAELTPEMAFAPEVSIRGGSSPGTFVCKELVYAYAMWISPTFHLHVIRAYDALVITAKSNGVTVADVVDLMQKMVPSIIATTFEVLERRLDQRLDERIASSQVGTAYGVTTGDILDEFKIKGVRGLSVRMSNILCKRGCQLDGGGRAHMGPRKAKLFHPDKSFQMMRDWLADDCRRYIAERIGQRSLNLVQKVG